MSALTPGMGEPTDAAQREPGRPSRTSTPSEPRGWDRSSQRMGLTTDAVRATLRRAIYYRSRCTLLDLVREAGWTDDLVDKVRAPSGQLS